MDRMPGPGFRYGASKSNLDRMFESSGLTGEVKKDMNLYPHLEKPPLPFPKDNIELVNKVEVMNRFADTIEKKLRDQPVIYKPKQFETPDIKRFTDKPTVVRPTFINYSRLPIELHPYARKIQKKRKFKPKILPQEIPTEENAELETKDKADNEDEEIDEDEEENEDDLIGDYNAGDYEEFEDGRGEGDEDDRIDDDHS